MKIAISLLLCLGALAPAQAPPGTFTAHVVHQEIGSENGGSAVIPLNGALIGMPIMRRTNMVILQTAHHRLEIAESSKDRHLIVLTVGGDVSVTREKQWFIILDSENKKHKFSVVSDQLTDTPSPPK